MYVIGRFYKNITMSLDFLRFNNKAPFATKLNIYILCILLILIFKHIFLWQKGLHISNWKFGRLRYCADVRDYLFAQNKEIEMRKLAYLSSQINGSSIQNE